MARRDDPDLNVTTFLHALTDTTDGFEMSSLDYLEKAEEDKMCPECAKHKKHVKLVESEGKVVECPVCHYTHMLRR
jgi:uncharacterized protein (UPF0212 family)